MEIKEIGIAFGVGLSVVWVLKVIADKMISKYFEMKDRSDDIRESFIHDKINRVAGDMERLSAILSSTKEEMVRHKLTMQGLSHEISALRNEIKAEGTQNRKSLEALGKVLHHINDKIKIQAQEIETIGRVIMRLPEEK